ncbi:hypothetical protein [Chlamydia felis]|uniref:hypothetical protein n=1 Tax=Chlamydia felis TaxID=83556 RepID=UPI0002E3913C|nr:hypothetical protein [Chlamydia felis]
MLFPRDDEGLWEVSCDWDLTRPAALKNSLLAAIPIVGSVMGLIKLFSVWSVKFQDESISKILVYTFTGFLEFYGLGIVVLLLKILYLFLRVICAAFQDVPRVNQREYVTPRVEQTQTSGSAGLLFS